MNGPDLFLICPYCGMKIEVTYAEGMQRPTALDESKQLETCPLCASRLIRIIDPDYNDKWDLDNEVKYSLTRRQKLTDMINKFDASNSKKLAELLEQKNEEEDD